MENYRNYINSYKILREVKSLAVSHQMYEFAAYIREIERRYFAIPSGLKQPYWEDFNITMTEEELSKSPFAHLVDEITPTKLQRVLTLSGDKIGDSRIKDIITLTFRKWKLSQI